MLRAPGRERNCNLKAYELLRSAHWPVLCVLFKVLTMATDSAIMTSTYDSRSECRYCLPLRETAITPPHTGQ